VLDILIYLFETYVNGDVDIAPDPDRDVLKAELVRAGFADRDIEAAFEWLESLIDLPASVHAPSGSIRVYSDNECERLSADCRGYLQQLETLGILNAVQREWVIDRLLAVTHEDIDIEEVKWVVLIVLFSQPDAAVAYARMEDLVLAEQEEYAVH
jgi:Smg protein